MADVIHDGLAWLAGQLKANVGQSVVYQRGAVSVNVTATVEQTAFRYTDLPRGRSKLEYSDADFVFTVSDLAAGGVLMPPQAGDVVIFGGETHRLMHPPGELPYKLDPYGIMVRVHTRRVA